MRARKEKAEGVLLPAPTLLRAACCAFDEGEAVIAWEIIKIIIANVD